MATIIQRGDTWRAQVRILGISRSATRGSKAEAEAWAIAEERQIRSGATDPIAPDGAPIAAGLTVAALCDRYAREVSPTKKGEYKEVLRLVALSRAFPMVATDLKGPAIREWKNRRLTEVTGSTVVREMALLSAVFKHAIKEWDLPIMVNPFSTVTWPKMNPARTRRVSDEERAAIMAALGWDQASTPVTMRQWVAWSFALALDTMMRRGEILSLTWDCIFPRHCHLAATKNGTSRDVPLSSRALALLELLTRGRPKQKVVPLLPATLSEYFADAAERAGLGDIHFHDARREAVSRFADRFHDAAELSRVSGHKSLKSLMIYYHPSIDDLADKLG